MSVCVVPLLRDACVLSSPHGTQGPVITSAPTGLRVDATTASTVTLSWDAPAFVHPEWAPVVRYRVGYRPVRESWAMVGGEWAYFYTAHGGGGAGGNASSSATLHHFQAGEQYEFQVTD